MSNLQENYNESYTASSIKVLSADEASETFLFAKVEKLVNDNPGQHEDFIRRLLEAILVVGADEQQVLDYYVYGTRKDKPELYDELQEAYIEIMKNDREGWR